MNEELNIKLQLALATIDFEYYAMKVKIDECIKTSQDARKMLEEARKEISK